MTPDRTDGTGPASDDEQAPATAGDAAAGEKAEAAIPENAPPENETAAALRAVEAAAGPEQPLEDEAEDEDDEPVAGEDEEDGLEEEDLEEDDAAALEGSQGSAAPDDASAQDLEGGEAGAEEEGALDDDVPSDDGEEEDDDVDDDDVDDNISDAEAEAAQAAKVAAAPGEAAAIPRPPSLPPRWDLENLKGAPTEAEVQRHKKSHVAPALIAIERVDEDSTFQMREPGDLSKLATDIARLGQLFPVELRLRPPDRFQVISGFRRVAALRFLQRDKVLARLHTDLSDEDALLMALASAIHVEPVTRDELAEVRVRLEEEGRLSPAARDMLEKALAEDDSLAPENVEEEVDAEELADDVTIRLGEINQDLSLLAEVFSQLDDQRKDELLKQLAYSAELVAFLGGK